MSKRKRESWYALTGVMDWFGIRAPKSVWHRAASATSDEVGGLPLWIAIFAAAPLIVSVPSERPGASRKERRWVI